MSECPEHIKRLISEFHTEVADFHRFEGSIDLIHTARTALESAIAELLNAKVLEINEFDDAIAAAKAPNTDSRIGHALAMRVLQSDLYRQLDETERSECDELIRQKQAPEVMDLRICEAKKYTLRLGQLYRFYEDPGCKSCKQEADAARETYGAIGNEYIADEAQGQQPSKETWEGMATMDEQSRVRFVTASGQADHVFYQREIHRLREQMKELRQKIEALPRWEHAYNQGRMKIVFNGGYLSYNDVLALFGEE